MKQWLMPVAVILLLTPASAFSQPVDGEIETYHKATNIGVDMFAEFLAREGRKVRDVEMLKACGKEGLAKAVAGKMADRKFMGGLNGAVNAKKFANLPSYALWESQSVANATLSGYSVGFGEGLRVLLTDRTKPAMCEAAIKAANDILSK